MQTHEWEALLHNATPGPWFAHVGGFGRIENIGPISTGFSIGDGLDCDEDDAILAAHAPAAVAEVVRLRREVAALRDQMTKSAERRKAMYDRGRCLDHLLAAEYDSQIAYDLTRILEGEEQ